MFKESSFHAYERLGWQRSAAGYQQGFAKLTVQAGRRALDVVEAGPGKRVLDGACGPGYVTALAAQLGAEAVGIDFSSEMIGMARQLHPQPDFLVGDLLMLPFADESLDGFMMNFAINHLEFPERALGEAFDKLKPGGKVAFTHWAKADQAVIFGFMHAAIRRYADAPVVLPRASAFDRFNDADECQRILIACDFLHPQVELVPQTWKVQSAAEAYEALVNGTVRIRATLAAQSPATRESIQREVIEKVSAYQKGEGIELRMAAMLAWAEK